MIPQGVSILILNFEYLRENETKYENILTRWSEAQASLNYVKNGGPKYRWTVPLERTLILSARSGTTVPNFLVFLLNFACMPHC